MQETHRFGRIEVRPLQRQLLVDGKAVGVGARAFDVLLCLIEHRGELVTKHQLLDAVWPDLVVEENNLVVQVGTLRKLLGADAIATIPGRGYRFTALPLDEVAPGAAPRAPELRTPLPESLPALIGRDDDLAALGALLDANRLITIVGAGGMGKTRLAERLLHERRAAHEHGVAWVPLDGLADPALLAASIAGALGLLAAAADPLQGLVGALKPLQMLVVLDNAEHLVDEVARVVQALLDGAPRVRLLVTSQVPLRLPQERVYRLGALAVPEADVPLADALDYGAVALFVERARAADRHFEPSAANLPAIVQICAQLDGVALAVELAAARVRMLGVTTLAASLDARLQLLTHGRRDAPMRQRTLRAALDWSHGLLGADEAVVFRRLGVFAGSFSLEMARQVAADAEAGSDAPLDDWGVVDALGALVDRSLVAADTAQAPRYRLLDSARAFALECLATAGEEAAWRQRHAAAITQHLARIETDCLEGRLTVDAAQAALEPDLDNARTALAWLLAHGDALGAVTLAPPMNFALTIVRHHERNHLWESTAACISDALPAAVRAAWAVGYSGNGYRRKAALSAAQARAAIEIYRGLGDTVGLYRALGMLALSTGRAREVDECAAACAQMRRLAEPTWSPRLHFLGAQAEAGHALLSGAFDAAHRHTLRALDLAGAAGDTPSVLNSLSGLADHELAVGRVDDAVRHGRELEQRLDGTRHQSTLAYARVNLCGALLAQDALVDAREMARLAWPLAAQFDIKHAIADSLALLAALERRPLAAAQLRGYADTLYLVFGVEREPNEARTAERAEQLARAQIGDTEFERLRAQGTALRDEDVLALALGAADAG